MERVGVTAQLAGVSGIMTAGYLEGAGAASEGTISFHNGAPIARYAQGQAFLDAYSKAGFREDPDAYGPFAYSAASLIMDAIEKVGPDRKKVKAELNTTKGHKALVGEINFDDHRQNIVTRMSTSRRTGSGSTGRTATTAAQKEARQELTVSLRAAALGSAASFTRKKRECTMDLGILAQQLFNGLMLGVIYAMIAVGFSLFFGVLDVIKFSHGDVVTVGAFSSLGAIGLVGGLVTLSPALALAAGVLAAVAIGGIAGALSSDEG